MKIGIIIQARIGSTRLPSKVLKPLPYTSDTSVIQHIINRAKKVKNADLVILATSGESSDDKLVDHISNDKVIIFRGSEDNVLQRYYQAALEHGISQVIRLTGDNPCIDVVSIEKTIEEHIKQDADYTYTAGYPVGMNIEIIKFSALASAVVDGVSAMDREHVTFYTRNNPEKFNLNYIKLSINKKYTDLRLTVDTTEDYTMMCVLFDNLLGKEGDFDFEDIQELYDRKPYVFLINKNTRQKKTYQSINDELLDARELLLMQDMPQAAKIISKHLR